MCQIEIQEGKTYETIKGELIKIKSISTNQIYLYNISDSCHMWLPKERVNVKRLIR
jgi:hypothetical protein